VVKWSNHHTTPAGDIGWIAEPEGAVPKLSRVDVQVPLTTVQA
jgi:hypothetical protein